MEGLTRRSEADAKQGAGEAPDRVSGRHGGCKAMIFRAAYSEKFVGRREELAFLLDELDAVRAGRLRFVTVEGEAGIGKSRLIAELQARARGAVMTAIGACEERVDFPYLPFGALLGAFDRRLRASSRWSNLEGAGEAKYAFFENIAATLARESTRRPLLCIIEDLHWADAGTIELTSHLVRHLHAAPILFVMTFRSGEPSSDARLAGLRSVAARARASTVALRGLARNEMRQLLQQMLAARDAFAPHETLAQIEEHAEGNPLFAEELLGAALDGGGLHVSSDVPVSVQAILAERLSSIDADDRELLIRAANLGRTFSLGLLATVVERSLVDVTAATQRAVRAGLLVLVDPAPEAYGFRHALIRHALAERLVFALAAPLHVRIATALEASVDGAASHAELAYHWAAARVAERARTHYERAAQAAAQVHAFRDAIRFYGEALHWQYPPGAERARLYEGLGRLLYIEGCGDAARTRFTQCREEHIALGDEVAGARASLLLADQCWVDADTTRGLHTAREAAQAFERHGEKRGLAEALLAQARFAITLGDAVAATAHLRRANRLQRTFSAAARADYHEIRGDINGARGDASEALDDCARATTLAARTGDAELIAQTENNHALVACDLGELVVASRHHERALHEAQRTAMAWRVAYCSLNFARTLTLAGDLRAARGHVRTALETGVDTATFKTKAASVGIPLALLLNDRPMLESCADERALEAAWRSGELQRIASVSAAFVELRFMQGAREEACSLLVRALRGVTRLHRGCSLLVTVARYGSSEHVALAQTLLAASSGRPRVRRAHALLLAAASHRDHLPSNYRRFAALAARQYESLGWTLYRAYALEIAGHTVEAAALRADMGGAADIPAAVDAPQPKSASSGRIISERQHQIAELVALGATNREIALRLHISENTVEHHVSNIFSRLGLRSRAQLSAYIVAGREAVSATPAALGV